MHGSDRSYTSWLWDGSGYLDHSFSSLSVGYAGGAVISIDAAEIGNPKRINFWASTSRGSSYEYGTVDWAPDNGEYSFTLRTSDQIDVDYEATPAAPRAGRMFRIVADATLADTGDLVEPESVRCGASLARKSATVRNPGPTSALTGRGPGACAWKIPRTARGKKLLVTVTVIYHGQATKRVVLFRIR